MRAGEPMRGQWLEGGKVSYRTDLPCPDPGPGESRVQVSLAGVCATDVALLGGYADFRGIPGHEFVGTALDGPFAGRRVVGDINAGCGVCTGCLAGDPRHCADRTVLGIVGRPGVFAEQCSLPTRNLVPLPDSVPDEAAVFAEPLAAALALEETGVLEAGARALVVGDGRLGLLCAWVLARAGLEVHLLGRHPGREGLLGHPDGGPGPRHLGHPLDAQTRLERGYDLAVEASGRAENLGRALACLRPRGTLVLKTTSNAPANLDAARLVVEEWRLIGSRCGRMERAVACLEAGGPRVQRLVEGRYALDRGEEAIERAARGGVLKLLIDPLAPEGSGPPEPPAPPRAAYPITR